MSTKPTVAINAANIEQIRTDLEHKNREVESLNECVGELRKALEEKSVAMSCAAARIAELEAAVAKFDAPTVQAAQEADDGDDDDGLIEIVALPEAGVTVPDLYYNRERMKRKKEKGYIKFRVPRDYAETLLGSTSGMKYILAGPCDSMEIKRKKGLYTETVTVRKHTIGETSSGTVFWKEVVVEESKEPVD